MAPNADPWRTLGLSPGATQDEIRRAYRRLAKVNHPDAAGESALPRFLAIQAAYEQLAGPGRTRRVGARPSSRPTDGAPAPEAREPWQADPNRARASGRADGRRSPGARPAGPGARTRPPAGGAQPGAAAGAPPGPGGAGPADDPESGGNRSRRSSRRRPANTATPGSTSYEGADQEPFEPGWSGATWYGASSGTYWTINPKEYADPRKHGPEYQARARRARDGWVLDAPPDAPPDGVADPDVAPPDPGADSIGEDISRGATGSDAPPAHAARAARASRASRAGPNGARRDGPRPSTDGPFDGRPGAPPAADSRSNPGAAGPAWAPTTPGPSPAPRMTPGEAPRSGGGAAGPPLGGVRAWIDQPAGDAGFRGPLLRRPTTPTGRLAMALLGWPPLGFFAGAVIDGSTGCGQFAASCPEVYAPGTWIVQAAIVLLLLAVPVVAAWSAHGAIAALGAGVPTAVILSAAGGSNVRETSGPVLLAVLAAAWIAGVAYAVVVARRRSRPA